MNVASLPFIARRRYGAPAPAVVAPAVRAGDRTPRRIVILSVSAGAGHVRAAQAIHAAALARGLDAIHLDLMDLVPSGYRKLYTEAYLALVARCPRLWGWIYDAANRSAPDTRAQRIRRSLERRLTRRARALLETLGPDAIVCTHFLPAEMLAWSRPACPVWVQVTDYDLHRAWVQPGMAGYFAASEEVAFLMRAGGIPEDAIRVTGIPLMPAFSQRFDRERCARDLGLDPRLPTVLLMGGGGGLGGLDACAARLLAASPRFQLVVLAGRNERALHALRLLAADHPGRLFPLPFTGQVERVMACADLAITKPGGLTVSECLAQGLPMILHAPIPGQEDRNAEYLLEQGVAMKAASPAAIEYRLRTLLEQPGLLARMSRRAREVARPDAARDVIDALLQGHADHAR
ncbi:MGDG synthase family glycosyltransferase [Noviherbaspirillum aridicola]|uniref:Monogalactosyldiacylglycerol synthase n=1 Tax=Noviherbaspirillum aridicola TaxID=2849687 RepID=A0ABQ4Q6G4_9BURK|nr:glycosyltransferase [Noviherbaspirillum aridicola]GIZ52814.1 hypothetical protein NCCP691_28280 [Noviherbaspirillum aridicola]